MKGLKFGVSLIVAVSVVASSAAVTCLADETSTVDVDATSSDQEVTVGNINVTSGGGLEINADNGYSATVTTGSITANGYYDGPNAYVEDGSNLDLTVNGDIYVDGDGLDLYTKYDSTSTVD